MFFVTLALLSATPAVASTPAPPLAQRDSVTVSAADPAKLAVAKRIAAKLLPDGSYRTMMGGDMTNIQQGLVMQMTALPVREFARGAGLPADKVAAIGPGTVREVRAIIDPVFDERIRLTTSAMNAAAITQLSRMELSIREGIKIAYANRFSGPQLSDIDAFFASSSGRAYAAGAWGIMSDPAVVARNQAMMKTMVAGMPAMMKAAAAATESLPAQRKIAALAPPDKTKLAALLGVDAATLI